MNVPEESELRRPILALPGVGTLRELERPAWSIEARRDTRALVAVKCCSKSLMVLFDWFVVLVVVQMNEGMMELMMVYGCGFVL